MRTLWLAMASLLLTVLALVLLSSRSLVLAQLPPALARVGRPLASQVPDVRAHSPSISPAQTSDDVWADAVIWVEASPLNSPSARNYAAIAYDSARGNAILFGGENYSRLGDTWKWGGTVWEQLSPTASPSVRTDAVIVYDDKRERLVLFGGFDGGWPTDTWEWDGSTWVQRATMTTAGGRTGHAMAFDIIRGHTVLFGGYTNRYMDDTWEWDGTNWAQQFPSVRPPARACPGMVYDAARRRVVLFGGYNERRLNDTWEWDGVEWVQRFPPVSPSARTHAALAYDSDRRRVVLFGGGSDTGLTDDTWEWDGRNWVQRLPPSSPGARYIHAIAYDTTRHSTILFGGTGADGQLRNDTWEYKWVTLSAFPSTRTIAPEQSTSFELATDGMQTPLTLSVSVLPQGITGQFWPSTVITPPAQATLMLTTSATTRDGLYPITLTARGDSFVVTTPVTLAVITRDFGLVPSPVSRTIYPGTSTSYSVAITASATFSQPVNVTLTGLPAGIRSSFTPNPVLPGGTTNLELAADLSAPADTYHLLLIGTAASFDGAAPVTLTRTTGITLVVLPAAITITVSPSSHAVFQGQSATYTLAVTATPGLTQPFSIAVEGLDDAQMELSRNPVPLGESALLTVTATLGTAPGTRSFTVSANSGTFAATTSAQLLVLPAGITLTVSPDSKTIYQGQPATYTLAVTATPGLTQPASLVVEGPEDMEITLSPNPLPLGATTTLTVSTTLSTTPGARNLRVTASSSGLTDTALLGLLVLPATITPTVSPDSQTVYRGQATSYNVGLSATPGFPSAATFQIAHLPQGTSYSLVPPSVAPGGSATLFITTTASTPLGPYQFTISGTAGSLVRSCSASLVVKEGVFLPLIMKRWPPIPYKPTLYAIAGSDDGDYAISWAESPSRLADTYVVQESTDLAFTTALRDVCTTSLDWCEASGKKAGTYYYRVRGGNKWGYGEWSNVQVASVLLPDTPILNAIDNAGGDGNYTVIWSAAARAGHYVLQEDTTNTFSAPVTVYEGPEAFWRAMSKTAGVYYYRVLSAGGTGQSGWSNIQGTTVLPPAVPSLNAIGNADGDGYYVITWGASARADSYTLQESTSSKFASPITVYEGAQASWGAEAKAPGTYYYRVRALGATGSSNWSTSRSALVKRTVNPPNDPYYGRQWGLAKVNAPQAWVRGHGAGLVIAIVDTGVDLDHPDLGSKLVAGWDFVNGDSTPQDDQGHGTHVAGIAAAVTNNGRGIAGLGWDAQIMAIKVLDSEGSGYVSDVADGIVWAANHGAKVINLSVGSEQWSDTLQAATGYAFNQGALVVAAAGNCGDPGSYWPNGCSIHNPPTYPAANPNVLAVGATSPNDARSSYSEYGYFVDVTAPGDGIYSTLWNNTYDYLTGTSMACPLVAGLAALVWSQNPTLSNANVADTIMSTAVDLGPLGRDDEYGWGRIDAARAVAGARSAESRVRHDQDRPSAVRATSSVATPVRAGVVLVRFRMGGVAGSQQSTLQRYGLQIVGEIGAIRVLKLRVAEGREVEVARQLALDPQVEFAEPDYQISLIR